MAGGLVGIVPLLLYNHYAFHSFTHLAYSDVPRQQKGFFGIGAPSPRVLITLLLDSRGLLTISPVLIMGAIGTVLLYKRAKRAEALTIGGICLCYLLYNSGYYLPFGGGFMGPRFLDTLLPFLAFPIALSLKRFPGPTIALAAVSITTTVVATITHPLVGYENETVTWMRYLSKGFFQPTIASAYGLGRGWGGIWPFLLAAGAAVLARRLGDAPAATVGTAPCGGACWPWWDGRCSRRSRRRCWGSTTPAYRASTTQATTPRSTSRCTRAPPIRCKPSPRWPPRSACWHSLRWRSCATTPVRRASAGARARMCTRARCSAASS